ncbi:helix-turn-helix domain-containing protein [Planococcus lenghuensis]|uniref:Myb-like domain-containing protein n=1 Tax=Planococcus lenghuensis TaxID=2213202 RepID=A0A1Q2L496_9BACL|nr:helix-turn-helix domain-containing protein [Planococcus lenghuensis]AQQ55259.1 hypothetical protein B0X71_18935 [Planococcus lenghuensis]
MPEGNHERKKTWSASEIEFLKEFHAENSSLSEIAMALGRSVSSVQNKAQKLGLYNKGGNDNQRWTAEEVAYLDDQWGVLNYHAIAKKLERTPEAVRVKAYGLGYSSFLLSQDGITLTALGKALHVNYSTLRRWERLYGLPAQPVKTTETRRKPIISLSAFWEWAAKNRNGIDFSRIAPHALGVEPEWVREQRQQDVHDKRKKKRYSNWTETEEKWLLLLVKQGKYTYKELAGLLNRPENTIVKKLNDCKFTARPLKASPRRWKEEDVETLLNLRRKGFTLREIADQLGRSEMAVKGKYQKLKTRESSR